MENKILNVYEFTPQNRSGVYWLATDHISEKYAKIVGHQVAFKAYGFTKEDLKSFIAGGWQINVITDIGTLDQEFIAKYLGE